MEVLEIRKAILKDLDKQDYYVSPSGRLLVGEIAKIVQTRFIQTNTNTNTNSITSIPLSSQAPPITRDHEIKRTKTNKGWRYPWNYMEVGDSFEVPYDPNVSYNQQGSLYSAAMSWAKRKKNTHRFTTAQTTNGFRIWRIK